MRGDWNPAALTMTSYWAGGNWAMENFPSAPVVAVVPVHRLCSVDLGGSGSRGPPLASF